MESISIEFLGSLVSESFLLRDSDFLERFGF